MRNDPHYVAVVSALIAGNGSSIWVKGIALQPGEKALVIFAPNQTRLYPLTDERRGTGKPIKFRVGPMHAITSSDHVIHEENGLAVFVPVASRQERVQWAIDRMRPTSLLDHLDVITELQHLICHRVITEDQFVDEDDMEYFQRHLRWALRDSMDQLTCAQTAITVGKRLAFDKGGKVNGNGVGEQ